MTVLIEHLEVALDRFEGLTVQIPARLQKISGYCEPEDPIEKMGGIKKGMTLNFVQEMEFLIKRFQYNNDRLEFVLSHLNDLIGS